MNSLLQIKHNLERLRKIYQQIGIDDADYLWPENYQDADSLIAVSREEINYIEQQWQIKLPEEYQQFLLTVGNINVGPGNKFYQLREGLSENARLAFPLKEPFLGQMSVAVQKMSPDEKWELFHTQATEWMQIPRDHGVIHICSYGCAIEAVLILNGPYKGKVWIYSGDVGHYGPFGTIEELHVVIEGRELTDSPKDYSFLEWYEHWLDNRLTELEEA